MSQTRQKQMKTKGSRELYCHSTLKLKVFFTKLCNGTLYSPSAGTYFSIQSHERTENVDTK